MRRALAVALLVAFALLGAVRLDRPSVWGVRAWGARLSRRLPNRLVPTPFTVLPPPESEYLGVWECQPDTARRRLVDRYGFGQLIRAYLHAYESGGRMRYEVASLGHRPGGFFGDWQLHVRLFGRPDGRTDVWCHWERNPNVAPLAHLRQDGYDPERGKRALRSMLEDETVVANETP